MRMQKVLRLPGLYDQLQFEKDQELLGVREMLVVVAEL